MAKTEPNWEDLHEKAGAAADEGFDDAFEKATKNAEAKANSKKKSESAEEAKKKKKERLERKKNLEELFAIYEKLARASKVEDVFEEFQTLAGASLESAIKSKYRSLQMQFHPDKFSSNNHIGFSKEVENIAKEVSQILSAFYEEAIERIKNPSGAFAKRRSRESAQNGTRTKFQDNIDAAKNAEADVMNETEDEPETDAKKEDEKEEKPEEETKNNDEKAGNKTREEESARGFEDADAKAEQEESFGSGGAGFGEGSEKGAEFAESGGDTNEGEKGNEGRGEKDPLLEKLEDVRSEYAKIEFENRSKWASVKRFFGFKDNRESEDVRSERERYEKTLDDYRNVKIAELQKKSEAGEDVNKEMSELLMRFNYGEIFDLAAAKDQARLESLAGSRFPKILAMPTKIADFYNKMPFWGKIALSVGVFAAGSAALIGAKRVLGGIVAGVGIAKGYQAWDERKMRKNAESGVEQKLKDIGKLDESERFERFNEMLVSKLRYEDGVVERTQNMLSRRGLAKAAAISVGSGLAVLGLAKFAEAFMDSGMHGGISDLWKSKNIFSSGGPRLETPTTDSFIKPDAGKIPSPFEQNIHDGPLVSGGVKEVAGGGLGINSDSLEAIGAVKGAAEGIAANHLEVPVGSGQSIESILIKTLEARGVENPGAVAHKMVLEYADSHDLTVDKLSHIKSANFDIESGGKNGFQIKDLKFDALKSHLGHAGRVASGGVGSFEPSPSFSETGVPTGGQGVNQEILRQAFENEASATNPYPAQAHDAYDNLRETNKVWEAASTRHVSPPSGSFLHDDDFGPKQVTDLHGPDADHVAELAAKREAYANMVQELGAKSSTFKEIGGSVIKEMSGNKIENWRQIKDLSFRDAMNQPETKTKILKTLVKLKGVLGEDAIKPLNGGQEKMGSMVTRLAKIAIEKGGK